MFFTSIAAVLILLSGLREAHVYNTSRQIPDTDIIVEARYNSETDKLEVKILSLGEE